MSLVPNISPAIGSIPYSFNMCQHFYQLSYHFCDDRFITSNFCCFCCDHVPLCWSPTPRPRRPAGMYSGHPRAIGRTSGCSWWQDRVLHLLSGTKKSGPCRFEVHEIDALQIDVLDDFEFDTSLIHVDIYLYILYCMYICLEHGSKVPPSGHRICWMCDRSRTILFDSMNILWVVLIMHSLFGGVSKFDPYAPIWKSCAWHVYVYVSRSIFQRIPDDW